MTETIDPEPMTQAEHDCRIERERLLTRIESLDQALRDLLAGRRGAVKQAKDVLR